MNTELRDLSRLVESGALPVRFGWRGPLERFDLAADALRRRSINGKVVFDVVGQPPG